MPVCVCVRRTYEFYEFSPFKKQHRMLKMARNTFFVPFHLQCTHLQQVMQLYKVRKTGTRTKGDSENHLIKRVEGAGTERIVLCNSVISDPWHKTKRGSTFRYDNGRK